MMKNQKLRKMLWMCSWIILAVSLACPTYCTTAHCSGPMSGFIDLLFGWFGALFLGKTYAAWFANPFLITAIFTNKKAPVLSLIFSVIALPIALTFLQKGEVLLNEAGHKGYVTELQIGYWLWLSSMIMTMAAAIVSVVQKKNKTISDQNGLQP